MGSLLDSPVNSHVTAVKGYVEPSIHYVELYSMLAYSSYSFPSVR